MERQIGPFGREFPQPRGRDVLDEELVERSGEILGEAQGLAGGTGAPASSGSSAPPILSSSSGSPIGTSRGISRPPPDRRTKASAIARAARLLGTSTSPWASPAGPPPKRAISPAASASAKARCGGMVKTAGWAGLTRPA